SSSSAASCHTSSMERSTRGSENVCSSVIAHHLLPLLIGSTHTGFICHVGGYPVFFTGGFTLQTAVDHDRHVWITAGTDLNTVPAFGIVRATKAEWALEMFVDAQAFTVDIFWAAIHTQGHMPDLSFVNRNWDLHAEKC